MHRLRNAFKKTMKYCHTLLYVGATAISQTNSSPSLYFGKVTLKYGTPFFVFFLFVCTYSHDGMKACHNVPKHTAIITIYNNHETLQ